MFTLEPLDEIELSNIEKYIDAGGQAVHLYRKYGFDEVPVDKEKFPFERADIAFEMLLEK